MGSSDIFLWFAASGDKADERCWQSAHTKVKSNIHLAFLQQATGSNGSQECVHYLKLSLTRHISLSSVLSFLAHEVQSNSPPVRTNPCGNPKSLKVNFGLSPVPDRSRIWCGCWRSALQAELPVVSSKAGRLTAAEKQLYPSAPSSPVLRYHHFTLLSYSTQIQFEELVEMSEPSLGKTLHHKMYKTFLHIAAVLLIWHHASCVAVYLVVGVFRGMK